MPITALWTLALAVATPAQAQPDCRSGATPLPAELAGWTAMTPLVAGAGAKAAAPLTIGRGARATLAATPTLRYLRAPEKPAAAGSFGGLFAVDVARAGRYRVALGEGAWIDVLHGDHTLPSVAHAHGPACSPIRKMVDFDLAPGRYVIQIAGAKAATLPLMIAAAAR
ncbi:hypothetical protein M9979_11910 [Sphingomonas sp. RP10(2022)]|uniref:Homogentisate 1,2-dioxygenase n=1 Tax=Sphingomonas liriopis TaxID=2949094 RepID=A0A9X2HTG2_9SPHN|nr:hypothetical protein [Sphingomonas liriopis]MCP3735577.1 hypothetical protein [Sphingomonas liriopis]